MEEMDEIKRKVANLHLQNSVLFLHMLGALCKSKFPLKNYLKTINNILRNYYQDKNTWYLDVNIFFIYKKIALMLLLLTNI